MPIISKTPYSAIEDLNINAPRHYSKYSCYVCFLEWIGYGGENNEGNRVIPKRCNWCRSTHWNDPVKASAARERYIEKHGVYPEARVQASAEPRTRHGEQEDAAPAAGEHHAVSC